MSVKEEARAQLLTATGAIRDAAAGLLRSGGVLPEVLALATAQVAAELAVTAARARGRPAGEALETLADVLLQSGREHEVMLALLDLSAAGHA